MEKKITTVYIDKDILEHRSKFKICLSEWINKNYREHFLSLKSKVDQLEEIHGRMLDLKDEIAVLRERTEIVERGLTISERRFLSTVRSLLREGKEITHIWRRFNSEFNRCFTFDEFASLVDFYEDYSINNLARPLIEQIGDGR